MTAEEKINELFEELVPSYGEADTVAGEIVRAVCRIGYRNMNDGDHIGVDYGNETCNSAARYLMHICDKYNRKVGNVIGEMWGVVLDDKYDRLMEDLEEAVLEVITNHPELRDEKNEDSMFNYSEYEDTHYEDDEDEDDEGWY